LAPGPEEVRGLAEALETPAARRAERIVSIDLFRGLTILAMIFVNHLSPLQDIPAWMKHVPPDQDGMTFVDVVFPAFLFIVGMAIPLAIGRRLERGESRLRMAWHVLMRTLSLLVIGVFMVNIRSLDPDATGMSRDAWVLLMFGSVILIWNQYPRTAGRRYLFIVLRVLGVAGLIWMATIYRGHWGEAVTRMQTAWWGILGLIGWAYLASTLTYAVFHRRPAALVGMLALFIALYIGDAAGRFDFPVARQVKEWVWLGGHIGGHSAITVAGILVTMILLDARPGQTPARRILAILLFAAGLFAAGYLLRPLHGISKNMATPTWCLYSSAICCVAYVILYWLVDVVQCVPLARPLAQFGANPLLAYILPDIFWAALGLLGVTFFSEHWNAGGEAIARAAVFAVLMVALSVWLWRLHVRLHV
jgi:predicted acyltransferase